MAGNPLKMSFWEPVFTKISRRLAGWEKAFLSRGRLTLIQLVLNALPTYFMSLYRIPSGIANLMEKRMRDFFTGNDEHGTHLVPCGST